MRENMMTIILISLYLGVGVLTGCVIDDVVKYIKDRKNKI